MTGPPALTVLRVWRTLLSSQLREQPVRLALGVLAIALGVMLATAIYLINQAALAQFTGAARRLVGAADLVVRGSRAGFDERFFATLARDPRVRVASPVLEVSAALVGRNAPLTVLGIDPFRAARLRGPLLGAIAPAARSLFRPDAILLSAAAAERLGLRTGGTFSVAIGESTRRLRIAGILPAAAYPQALGLMDIASAQWAFERVGRLSRIDLRLAQGVDPAAFRAALAHRLPVGVRVLSANRDTARTAVATRAYRVNLDLLASIALWSGAFLVFATQSLAVLRRRASLALLRALGVTRGELQAALVAEGASLGALGSVLGVVAGAALAAFALRNYRGDLGDGHLRAVGVALLARPAVLAVFLAVGTLVATIGAWFAARSAARRPPAAALKGAGGDADPVTTVFRWRAGAALGALGAVLAWLPSIGGLALFGYASIAALLLGAVLLVPVATAALLRTVPAIGRPVIDTALAQLRDNVGPATLSLGSIVVSFGLMVAMMTMVHSFRLSFEAWLGQLLPADLEMRVPLGSNSAYWSAAEQNRIASIAGVARVEFRRTRRISLDPARPAVTLIARDIDTADARRVLPIVREAAPPLPAALPPAWISEGLQDLYGARVGAVLTLPLGGRAQRFAVAGVWRDYARSDGSVVVPRPAYEAATGDRTATQASLWLAPGATVASVEAAVRKLLAPADAVEIRTSTDIRARSLRIFDRAFAITYALEAVAVAIGLAGVAFAIGSTTLARRAEFGMLRHIGLRRRDVIALLATEGVALTALGVLYGLLLGLLLSLVLVYVVDRQSFHWSIDLAVPLRELLTLGAILVAAAASTALVAGRAAMSADAVRAIREDW